MAILPTFPKFLQDRLMGLGEGIANAVTGGDRGNSAPAPVVGDPRKAVEYMIHSDRSLTDAQRSMLMQWLQGQPLMDPALVEKVNSVTMGQPVEGAGAKGAGPVGGDLLPPASANLVGLTDGNGTVATASTLPAPPAANISNTTPPPSNSTPLTTAPSDTPWATDAGGEALLSNPGMAGRFVGRQLGLDPEKGGLASTFFSNLTAPTMQALAALYQELPGQGEGMNYGQVGGNLANFGRAFITPGQSGFGLARQYAQQIANGPEFGEMLAGVGDQDTEQGAGAISTLENLMALKNAGARGLRAGYLGNQYRTLMNQYQDSIAGLLPGTAVGSGPSTWAAFLAQHPELAQRLFGFVPR